ncbi:MAG: hypothetical protein LBI60_03545 [Bacteroidales bacterium]|nr:hypothetical protein [Bacteroidales bacterium]
MVKWITKLSNNGFVTLFEAWESNGQTEKSHFTHKKLLSAWLSIKNNLPYLFAFEQVDDISNKKASSDDIYFYLTGYKRQLLVRRAIIRQ